MAGITPAPPPSPRATIARWATRTVAGRILAAGVLVKLAALLLSALGLSSNVVERVDMAGGIALMAGAVILASQLFVQAKRRLLWRVRRRLTVSYIFIGVVPALLIIAFFLIAGLLLFYNVSSYMMRSRVAALVEDAGSLARAAASDVEQSGSLAEVAVTLERRRAATAAARYPGVAYAVVPAETSCGAAPPAAAVSLPIDRPIVAGGWSHLEPPDTVPAWVPCEGFAGLVVYTESGGGVSAPDGRPGRARLAARAVAWPDLPGAYAVMVDVPLDAALVREFFDDTGIEIGSITALAGVDAGGAQASDDGSAGPRLRFEWVAFLDYVDDWETGGHDSVWVSFRMGLVDIFQRVSGTPLMPAGGVSLGQLILLVALAIIGGLFLIIQAIALMMGLALARSITGAIHELFVGTERVRRGDFGHTIAVRSRDQLGELADSFNSMTASIEDLLRQKAEKERLAEELRIARAIQMSLLPRGSLVVPGVSVMGHCEPAREVGGDYYDLLTLDEHRLGILIADVAGKGTSAALYMAELKGIVQSLSQFHASPRGLLIDADRILARHLDVRSFITVIYAVFDLRTRTLTYARAGHCPLLYVPGPYAPVRTPQVLTPDGMVLGLQLDSGEMFSRLLEEATLTLSYGDLVLLYTDGITEAMDEEGECFGDARLAHLVQQHADLPAEELRERILREVGTFSGGAAQHDDMTLVLLRMEEMGSPVMRA